MPGGFLNRHRAERLMAEQGIDALVLAQPETITYATGAFPGVAAYWRRAGAAFVVVPADCAAPLVAIVGDLQAQSFASQSGIADVRSHRIWVETGQFDPVHDSPDDVALALGRNDLLIGKPERQPRPAQFSLETALSQLRDVLAERGLLAARIGLELGFVAAADFPLFKELLPDVRWADSTRLIEQLRAVKAPTEIERLRQAAELSAAGVSDLMRAIRPGMDAGAMTAVWRDAVLAEAGRRKLPPPDSTWAYIAVGGDGFVPGGKARTGDVVKIDAGCIIGGYSSDGGRTSVIGRATPNQRQVYDALRAAFELGFAELRPWVPLAAVYRSVSQSMWNAGFTTYCRGHFGHGVGSSIWSEEWPFISAKSTAAAEPGMVLAFETPYYIAGIGGFIIEDQLLVTETGIEVMAPSSRDLIEID